MNYSVPKKDICFEQVINKSRFITHVARAENKAAAKTFIASIKAQYPDARHHCWAFIAGHPTASVDIGFSDDGEPSGTAGKPILNVLQHRGIGEIVLVVVRYFGGIKLGAGGLVRAYSSSAHLAMQELELEHLIETKSFDINCAYTLEKDIKHILETYHIPIESIHYSDIVSLNIKVPTTEIEALNQTLINSTSGKISLL